MLSPHLEEKNPTCAASEESIVDRSHRAFGPPVGTKAAGRPAAPGASASLKTPHGGHPPSSSAKKDAERVCRSRRPGGSAFSPQPEDIQVTLKNDTWPIPTETVGFGVWKEHQRDELTLHRLNKHIFIGLFFS